MFALLKEGIYTATKGRGRKVGEVSRRQGSAVFLPWPPLECLRPSVARCSGYG